MVIHLNDATTVRQIKNQFSIRYPYLKLILLHPVHKKMPGGRSKQLLMDERLGEFAKGNSSKSLEIQPWNTIADVEGLFKTSFGLGARVRVLQNSDGHWIEPEETDTLTLKEQNEKGYQASDHIVHPQYDDRIEEGEY